MDRLQFKALSEEQQERAMLKDSIVVYRSWLETWIDVLTPEQVVEVLKVLMDYYPCGCQMQRTGDAAVDVATAGCAYEMDKNLKKYLNSFKGGRPKKDAQAPEVKND